MFDESPDEIGSRCDHNDNSDDYVHCLLPKGIVYGYV